MTTTSPNHFSPGDVSSQEAEQNQNRAARLSALNAQNENPAKMSAKGALRLRAKQLRHAADQLDAVAGMLPEQLSQEQEYALSFTLNGTNLTI